MKCVIFAGGFGTRLSEETHRVPKPMVEIGEIPILVHIMHYYMKFDFNDFILCCGYKTDYIKNYFFNYMRNTNDLDFNFSDNSIKYINPRKISWRIQVVDTGLETQTAGRLKRVSHLIDSDNFMLTYGDGLSNIDLHELKQQHLSSGLSATLSAVVPASRFGALSINNGMVVDFSEKPIDNASRINGGFMCLNKSVMAYISSDSESFEIDILPQLAKARELGCYMHDSFWHPMDTLRDKKYLESLWLNNEAPWKV